MACFVLLLFSRLGCFWFFFFFKQKTAYERRISDWSSDVCSSDLVEDALADRARREPRRALDARVDILLTEKARLILQKQFEQRRRAERSAPGAPETQPVGHRPVGADLPRRIAEIIPRARPRGRLDMRIARRTRQRQPLDHRHALEDRKRTRL